MTRALFRTIVGRKGSFLGTAGVTLAAVVVVAVVLVIVHGLRPGRNPSIGGQPMLDGVSAAIWLLGGVGAIVIGALAGSYDVAQGTMRYLVLTGVRRIGMYAARTIALIAAVLLALLPALVLGLVLVFVLPSEPEAHVNASEVGDVVWTCVLWPTVFAVIAMGIGSLLRSNGAAVAISLFFAFAAAPAPRAGQRGERDPRQPDVAACARPRDGRQPRRAARGGRRRGRRVGGCVLVRWCPANQPGRVLELVRKRDSAEAESRARIPRLWRGHTPKGARWRGRKASQPTPKRGVNPRRKAAARARRRSPGRSSRRRTASSRSRWPCAGSPSRARPRRTSLPAAARSARLVPTASPPRAPRAGRRSGRRRRLRRRSCAPRARPHGASARRAG